ELLDEVAQRLERDMLLDLETASSGSMRIATTPTVRRDMLSVFTSDSLGRRLALAASILLVLGAGAIWTVIRLGGPPAIDLGPIARGPEFTEPEGTPPHPSGLPDDEDPVRLAIADTVDPTPVVDVASPTPLVTSDRVPLTLAEARALLAERRLMIRVRSADGLSTLASLRDMRDEQPVWRVDEGAESIVLAQMERPALPVLERGVTLPVVVASDRPDEGREPSAEERAERERLNEFVAVYGASLDAESPALGALLSLLTMPGQEAVFEALDEPADLMGDLTPRSVIWWSRSSHWRQRVHVPILVEAVR
ncbi:MAG: hypothetical protein KDA28_05780, partial [Phycisphaerales bacterium]|nr:hypothetical protein [Phycisphaerales bacterium]